MNQESINKHESLLKGKQLLIFDFDGTLADTSRLHEAAFNNVLSHLGISVDYSKIAGLRTGDAIAKCLEGAGLSISESGIRELVISKQIVVRELISKNLKALPGVDTFLQKVRSRFRCALYSSGSRGTVTIAIEKLGYTGWFDPMLCAEDVTCAKPNPEGYLRILSMTQCRPEDALVFEDSDAGVCAARNAGLMICDVRLVQFSNIKTEFYN